MPTLDRIPTKAWLVTGLLALVCAVGFQGSRGLFESTEGRYSLCALEMVRSGNWLEPTLAGQPHWTKPPLGYWGIAAGLATLGPNEWGARISNSLVLLLTAAALGFLAATFWDRRTGLLAALVYSTSVFPVLCANTVNTDTMLCLWEVLAVLCFVRWYKAGAAGQQGSSRLWVLGMWGAFGLAFFTKGPPGLLPLPVLLIWWWRQERATRPRGLFWVPGLLLFAAVAFSWFLLMILRHPGLLGYLVGDEVINRVASDKFHRNPEWYKPFTMYLPALLLGGGPWTWWLGRWAWEQKAWRAARVGELWRAHGWGLLMALWLGLPLVVFSLSRSRLPNYVLPLFAPVALLIAWRLRQAWSDGSPLPTRFVGVALSMTVLMVAGKGLSGHPEWISRDNPAQPGAEAAPPRASSLLSGSKKDMRLQYRSVQTYDDPATTEFVLFEEDQSYGFDFYVASPVKRVFTRPERAWNAKGGIALSAFIESLRTPTAAGKRYLFLCHRGDAGPTATMLAKVGGLNAQVLPQTGFCDAVMVTMAAPATPAAPPGP